MQRQLLWTILIVIFLLTALVLTLLLIQGKKLRSQELDLAKLQNSQTLIQNLFDTQFERQAELIDKLTTMLGTKDPMSYQAVQIMSKSAHVQESNYDPSDEAEARRIEDDRTRNYADADEYSAWDDPASIAREIGIPYISE